MSNLTSLSWWKAAGIRALRTALVILAPFVPTVLADGNYLLALSAAGFAALSSLVTSLFGIAETEGKVVPWYWALTERVTKTAAQALLTVFGTATLFEQVDWSAAPAIVGTAVLGSLLLGVLKTLPETTQPLAPAVVTVTTGVDKAGNPAEQSVAVVAPAPVTEAATPSSGSVIT
jgi:hypothetical protein